MNRAENGFVYFIKPVGMGGPIKIGWSLNPVKRLETFMAWSPFKLEILATAPGDMKHEYQVHNCFADSHSHREWFHPSDRLMSAINKIISGMPLTEAIDLDAPVGKIRHSQRNTWSPSKRRYMSYSAKIRWRFQNRSDLFEPRDVHLIIFRWSRGIEPTQNEIARLEAVIADPDRHGTATDLRFVSEAA